MRRQGERHDPAGLQGAAAPAARSSSGVFRVEDPASFARIAFVQALRRAGVTVSAAPLAKNAPASLPARGSYAAANRVAAFVSPPYSEFAKLVLKVSLNLGANLSLSLFGVEHGARTSRARSRSSARRSRQGVTPSLFDFPTNGSGSPDSRAAPRAVVQLLAAMRKGANGAIFHDALPILGVDGSLAETGRDLPRRATSSRRPARRSKDRTKAQVLAGYIDAKSGRKLAFALFVNDAGPIKQISDVGDVFTDEGAITNAIYMNN